MTQTQTAQRILWLCRKEAAGLERVAARLYATPVTAERLGLIASADAFLAARRLRHRLVHEYVEDRNELAANLGAAHAFVPHLRCALDNVAQAITRLPQGSSQ